MKNNFIEELKWRGLLHDVMPGTEELLLKEVVTGYVGFDPTAKSLTIGNLVTVMLLVHFQRCGHKPIALVGGATGMIGDPSFKSEERKFLSDDDVRFNMECIRKQLEHFLDFDSSNSNCAEIVNNYDWFKDISFLQFLRDVGKHLTINYMCAKDSVKKRIETGLSFTEFSYQLLQGHDFYHLNQTKNVKLQMGGSDQWGNITSGNELIRRRSGNESYALTCPLLTKSDGTKFGKSEGQNIWLDGDLTSPYKFYQFWLNTSDDEALKYIKIFTTFEQSYINNLEREHNSNPHLRLLQKELAKDITCRVHSVDEYQQAVDASEILFGKGTFESLNKLNDKTILSIFEGVPQSNISRSLIASPLDIVEFLVNTNVLESKAEARRMLKSNAIGINKNKIEENKQISRDDLVNNKYIIVQKGKKNYHLVICREL